MTTSPAPPPPVSRAPVRFEPFSNTRVFTEYDLQFTTDVLEGNTNGTVDDLPALYRFPATSGTIVDDPSRNVTTFLQTELSFEGLLENWSDCAEDRPPHQLHFYVAMELKIIGTESMGLHLVQDNAAIFLKPLPRFLLDADFWQTTMQCPESCACNAAVHPGGGSADGSCLRDARKIALGFLYSYACLVSSETDFAIANEHYLLPRLPDGSSIKWDAWKTLARELQRRHDPDKIHRRFLHGEVYCTHIVYHYRNGSSTVLARRIGSAITHKIIVSLSTFVVFAALVLTAMQLGLATRTLQGNDFFQWVAVAFTILSLMLFATLLGGGLGWKVFRSFNEWQTTLHIPWFGVDLRLFRTKSERHPASMVQGE